jgi:hypothetical protein
MWYSTTKREHGTRSFSLTTLLGQPDAYRFSWPIRSVRSASDPMLTSPDWMFSSYPKLEVSSPAIRLFLLWLIGHSADTFPRVSYLKPFQRLTVRWLDPRLFRALVSTFRGWLSMSNGYRRDGGTVCQIYKMITWFFFIYRSTSQPLIKTLRSKQQNVHYRTIRSYRPCLIHECFTHRFHFQISLRLESREERFSVGYRNLVHTER